MSAHDEVGFVIETREYRENSLLVRLITRGEGYIGLVARGVGATRKSKGNGAGLLQSFNLVRVLFSLKDGQTLGNLTKVELESGWLAPRESLESYSLTTWWFEILRHSSQARQDTSGVFECTLRFLESQEIHNGLSGVLFQHISQLCHALGYGLNWNVCSICGRGGWDFSAFSVKSGLIC